MYYMNTNIKTQKKKKIHNLHVKKWVAVSSKGSVKYVQKSTASRTGMYVRPLATTRLPLDGFS